ncbi:uncharacterized protein MONBRDRAFT_25820 [Monosiga brevicollis MX1]|uniref:C2H2-type domain-containing protein n=1 Tax=Monosiga brevicollis TaxID=81824 RepID=A9V0J0_MONBE|nr:uncharacterized protein MONBRDRAFT_25820 [Monosiga brevicollis MX1]EDQ89160.1 predicted protein [Monosiga brevicollis MX1]|eukprot:XP_001746265.1 hypothetical protein [Monosiga brevicollis MX1]
MFVFPSQTTPPRGNPFLQSAPTDPFAPQHEATMELLDPLSEISSYAATSRLVPSAPAACVSANHGAPLPLDEKRPWSSLESSSSGESSQQSSPQASPGQATSAIKLLKATTVGEFHCSICCRNFISRSALEIHNLSHTKVKRFECDKCGKRFARRSHLSVSLPRRSHETRDRKSKGQEVDSSTRAILKQHIHNKIHLNIKDHVCHICGRGFVQSSNLRSHIRRHTGEKPYDCHLCSRSFSVSSSLKAHLKSHERRSKRSVTKCEDCHLMFKNSDEFVQHKALCTSGQISHPKPQSHSHGDDLEHADSPMSEAGAQNVLPNKKEPLLNLPSASLSEDLAASIQFSAFADSGVDTASMLKGSPFTQPDCWYLALTFIPYSSTGCKFSKIHCSQLAQEQGTGFFSAVCSEDTCFLSAV